MNPIFSHDATKFVYQKPDIQIVTHPAAEVKPFIIERSEKSEKTKKEMDKQKKDKKNRQSGFFDFF